jgi:hypothetical protein
MNPLDEYSVPFSPHADKHQRTLRYLLLLLKAGGGQAVLDEILEKYEPVSETKKEK